MKRNKAPLSSLKKKENRIALGFISVKYVGETIFVFVPVLFSILYSFTDYNAARETEPFFSRIGDIWIWFGNYKQLFTHFMYSEYFLRSVGNNLFMLLSVPLGIIAGLLVAAILSRPAIRFSGAFRMLIYMPVVAGAVAMNIIWRYMFDNQYGLINQIFGTQLMWLTDDWLVKTAIIIKNVWGGIGRTMILCLAAMFAVDNNYYEAAKLDGEDGIIDQGYSLNAGRYVGVVIEDDGMTEAEFKETMLGLNAEYESLNEEAKKLETQISLNLRGLFKNE